MSIAKLYAWTDTNATPNTYYTDNTTIAVDMPLYNNQGGDTGKKINYIETDGSLNVDFTLTVNTTPSDATVTFNTGTVSGKTCTVKNGTTVTYTVSRNGYVQQTFTAQVTSNKMVNSTIYAYVEYFNCNSDGSNESWIYYTPGDNNVYTKSGNNFTKITSSCNIRPETYIFYKMTARDSYKSSGLPHRSNTSFWIRGIYSGYNNTYQNYPFKYTLFDENARYGTTVASRGAYYPGFVFFKTLPSNVGMNTTDFSLATVDSYTGTEDAIYSFDQQSYIYPYNHNFGSMKNVRCNDNYKIIEYNSKLYHRPYIASKTNKKFAAYATPSGTLYYIDTSIKRKTGMCFTFINSYGNTVNTSRLYTDGDHYHGSDLTLGLPINNDNILVMLGDYDTKLGTTYPTVDAYTEIYTRDSSSDTDVLPNAS